MKNTKKYRALEVLIYFTLLLISFFLQSTEIIFKYNSPAPSLILALVLVICFYENYLFSSIFGLFAGILIDSISTNGSGFHALIYMLTGFICSVVLESFFQKQIAFIQRFTLSLGKSKLIISATITPIAVSKIRFKEYDTKVSVGWLNNRIESITPPGWIAPGQQKIWLTKMSATTPINKRSKIKIWKPSLDPSG